jgi:hypothetical protein
VRAGRVGAGGAARPSPALRYAPYQSSQAPLAARASGDETPEDHAKAIALLDRVIAARGGLDTLRGLKTIVARQTQTSQPAAGPTVTETTNYIQYPDKFLVDAPGLVQGFDGKQAWASDARGVHVAPDTVARDARASLRRDVVSLLLAAKDGALKTRLLANATDASGHTTRALELSAADLDPIVLYINADSAMVEKRAFAANAPGRPIVEEQFSDYRPVDGIQVPFHATQTVGPLVVERQIIEVKVNPPVDPVFFKRPAS